jgi:hypothetical protein
VDAVDKLDAIDNLDVVDKLDAVDRPDAGDELDDSEDLAVRFSLLKQAPLCPRLQPGDHATIKGARFSAASQPLQHSQSALTFG